MKFSIRVLFLVTVLMALCGPMSVHLLAEDDSKVPGPATSYWMVIDSYDGGKNTRDDVGQFVVLANGKLYFASLKEGMITYGLKPFRADVGERFELLEDGALFGSGLLIRERGMATLYVNQINPANGKARTPEPRINRCDHVFVCTPILEAEGKARLAKYGAKP